MCLQVNRLSIAEYERYISPVPRLSISSFLSSNPPLNPLSFTLLALSLKHTLHLICAIKRLSMYDFPLSRFCANKAICIPVDLPLSTILPIIADEKCRFIRYKIKNFLLNSLGKGKTVPLFSKITTRQKKKKPLSRRGNHALIAAIFSSCFLFYHQGNCLCTRQVLSENPSFPLPFDLFH